jgi:pimeloyl-ACP methyl ester carboxylesterase
MALYVEETGAPGAPSIVFLHGIGASGWMWRRQTAALADYHCLNVDLPGHGQSNHVAWESLADASEQIAVLIQARATHGQAHIVGLSLGGYIALALLPHHADVVDHVVISGVTAAPMPNRALLGPQLGVMSFLLRRRWFVEMQARAMHIPPDMQSAFVDNLLAMSMSTYRRIYAEGAEFHVPAALSQIDTPTLVAAGGRESDIILQAVDAIPKLMPHARGCLAPGLDHGWNVEDPALFSAMLRAWFTDRPLPAGLQVLDGR